MGLIACKNWPIIVHLFEVIDPNRWIQIFVKIIHALFKWHKLHFFRNVNVAAEASLNIRLEISGISNRERIPVKYFDFKQSAIYRTSVCRFGHFIVEFLRL